MEKKKHEKRSFNLQFFELFVKQWLEPLLMGQHLFMIQIQCKVILPLDQSYSEHVNVTEEDLYYFKGATACMSWIVDLENTSL